MVLETSIEVKDCFDTSDLPSSQQHGNGSSSNQKARGKRSVTFSPNQQPVSTQSSSSSSGIHRLFRTKQKISVKELTCEVNEKGMEFWQRLASFQMPWDWCGKGEAKRRRILNDVSFEVKSGQMLAILGSSGSGKTTLLDVIAGQSANSEITGDVFFTSDRLDPRSVKESIVYVRQDDRLLPHLTVLETLTFVAKLKLPTDWSESAINERVESVIAELGLRHVANSKVGGANVRGISGGERRRVSIGVQLLQDPRILLLDEPTSGLDAFTAHHLMETLASLAANNRIVLLTIHQPRSDIFDLFDLIMLLSQGTIVYYGQANQLIDYFTSIGYPCPELTNPCDYYVDLTTVDMKTDLTKSTTSETLDHLVNAFNATLLPDEEFGEDRKRESFEEVQTKEETVGTRSEETFTNAAFQLGEEKDEEGDLSNDEESQSGGGGTDEVKVEISGIEVMEGEDTITARSLSEESSSRPDYEERPTRKVSVTTARQLSRSESTVEHPTAGLCLQFWIILRRALRNNLADYGFLGIQAIEAVAMSLIIGLVYFDLGLDQMSMRDRFGLLYIIGALYPYLVILDVIGQYHRERHCVYFEMQDGLYSALPYFFSKLISELPEHSTFIVLYTVPVYFLAGLQVEVELFFQAFAIIYLVVYCSRSLAMWAAAFMPTYQLSVLVAQSCFTCFLLSAGFIFNIENIFVGVQWIASVSYLKWGFQALCHTEFSSLNFTCSLPEMESCVYTGDDALKVYAVDEGEVWQFCLIVLAEILLFLIFFFISIKFRSQKPHEA